MSALDTLLIRFGLRAPKRQPVSLAKLPRRIVHRRRKGDRWRPVTEAELDALYRRPDAFTDLLPWVEYLPQSQSFLLDDGRSVGALLELTPVACEARPESFLEELRGLLQGVLAESLREEDESPWVAQFFVQDEPSLLATAQALRAYAAGRGVEESAYTRAYLALMDRHLAQIARPPGLFVDTAVTGGPWRGKRRRVRMTLHRRLSALGAHPRMLYGLTPEEDLNEAVEKLGTALTAAGIGVRRCAGEDLYQWLLPWLNPRPACARGEPERLLALSPYPADEEEVPYGRDFGEMLTYGMPVSDLATNTWWLDGLPHRAVTVQGLRLAPKPGHFSAERLRGENRYALLDRLPEGSILAQTLIVLPQDAVRSHIGRIRHASGGPNAEARLAREEADAAEHAIAQGNKLYPLAQAVYLWGEDLDDLRRKTNEVQALLIGAGLQPVTAESDLTGLDAYVRFLPMAFDPRRERLDRVSRRSRLVFTHHSAALLPALGRARGTGHPGVVLYNRGGDPVTFDPLNSADRKKSSHMVVLGPTGSGKSATLVYLLMQMMALYRPRLFVIDAGNSFGLLGQYFRAQGLTVHAVAVSAGADVSLPPFADALTALEAEAGLAARIEAALATPNEADDEALLADSDDEEGGRDWLGEMEIAARVMITGGEAREEARITRADRLVIRKAILAAAQRVKDAGRAQVLTQDVVAALHAVGADARLAERRRARAEEMGAGMELFCSGLGGRLFNRPGTAWPEADVTLFEMGLLAREGYEDQLTVAYLGLMNRINDLVEREARSTRQTLVLTDEGHIITTNPLLAPYVVKITKMWRKFGAWLWIATQNLQDFPDAAKRMLNMMEWWLCLVMPKEEVEQIARFRDLTDEERSLLLSAHKEPGKYVEGVVLSDALNALFRSVPPALALALAMTEKHEKAERAGLMRKHGGTELEAVHRVAERIERERGALAQAGAKAQGRPAARPRPGAVPARAAGAP